MREIKFRAWDKDRKEIRQVQLMDWSDWWVSTGSTWERGNSLEYGERNSFENEETDRHILMQYTGLKDKKDKEYYEGDICVRSNDRKKGVYTVVWQDNGFKLEIIVRKKYGDASWNEKVHVPIFPNSYEIIGNIYSNPELLEVTP